MEVRGRVEEERVYSPDAEKEKLGVDLGREGRNFSASCLITEAGAGRVSALLKVVGCCSEKSVP